MTTFWFEFCVSMPRVRSFWSAKSSATGSGDHNIEAPIVIKGALQSAKLLPTNSATNQDCDSGFYSSLRKGRSQAQFEVEAVRA